MNSRDEAARPGATLQVEQLSVRFGGLRAVEAVDFDVSSSEIVGLVGPNGAGKTTIFNTIFGMLSPSSGRILFDGRNVAGLPPYRLNAMGMARTFQNVRLFAELSVRENVMMGAYGEGFSGVVASALRIGRHRQLERVAAERADYWIDRLGLRRFSDFAANTLPLGFQRIAEVARAMAGAPRLLLLDEPAAGLNVVEKQRLSDLLAELNRETGCSILMIDHDVRLVMRLVHRIVVLDFGEKIADGRPEQIVSDPRVIEAYLGV